MTTTTPRPATATTVWQIDAADGPAVAPSAPQHRHLAARPEAAFSTPLLELRLTGPLDTGRLRAAAEHTLREHPALRRHLASAVGAQPPVLLARLADDSHTLRLSPALGSVDTTGLLRTAAAIAADYTSGTAAGSGPDPRTVDDFLAGLLTDPGAAAGREHWQTRRLDTVAEELARALVMRTAAPGPRLHLPVPLDDATSDRLIRLARDLQAGVDAVVGTVWRLMLHRIAPGEDAAMGLFVPGPAEQLPDTIGLLGRCVPVPVRPETAGSLTDAIRSCHREIALAARLGDFFTHQRPGGEFTVGFRHVEAPGLDFGPGLAVTVEAVRAATDRVRLDLHSLHTGGRLLLALEADSAAVTEESARRLATWLAALCAGLPDLLDIPAQAAAGQILDPLASGADHPDTGTAVPSTLVEAFTTQAELTPAACAARDDDQEVTYRELAVVSAVLAQTLAERGVAAGDRVAVCMSRRVPLLAVLLAVARRGAAFVPIDPALPAGRVADLLADAGPRLLVTDLHGDGAAPLTGCPPVLRIDALPSSSLPDGPEPAEVRPETDVYVIYTSGSTGRPKGVPITHAALMNYLGWAAVHYGTADGSGTLAHSSISVDMTVTSLFLPLLTGQAVTLLPSDEPKDLADALTRARDLSPLKVTPGGLRLLATMLTGDQIAQATRHLVVGGEQLTAATLDLLNAPGLPVTNEYGPTEATVGCCAHTLRLGEHPAAGPVPIGTPIRSTMIELRTPDGRLALPGTAGELVVTGPGVAAGYLGLPAETDARFTADPHTGVRSYRTGDLAVLGPGGQLVMLGRGDDQLKIHGYRIEPGEIEAVLTGHPGITAAAVTTTSGTPVLAAFLVPAPGADPAALPEAATALAADRLPFYARPDRYEVLDQLPLRGNGKVDRRALAERPAPAPVGEALDAADPQLAVVAALWSEVLGAPPSSPDANFFAEGGDSIKAVLLAGRAQRAGLELTVHDILQRRTLRRIAAAVRPAGARDTVKPGPVPLTPHQAGFLARGSARPQRWIVRWSAEAPAPVDAGRLELALAATVAGHEALRTSFTCTGGRWTARLGEPDPVPVHVLDLDGVPDASREPAIADALEQVESGIDLAGPLLGLCLIRAAGQADRIVWIVHHLVADVVSLQSLNQELWHAYASPAAAQRRGDGYAAWLRDQDSRPATPFPSWPRSGGPAVCRTAVSRLGADACRHLADAQQAAPRWALAVLAAAVLGALAEVRPDLPAALCAELHGRDRPGLDLAAAVGWLTDFRPLRAEQSVLVDPATLAAALHHQVEQPQDGNAALPAIALNYLGDLPAGQEPDLPDAAAGPLFGLEAVVWTGPETVDVRWRFDEAFIPAATVTRLADAFARHAATTLTIRPQTTAGPAGLSTADQARLTTTFEGGRS
ncbi:amino acid adenylation domain-containing protein [Streptomyces acidiscabies]|uniref:Amino acid adenylation domain-containing protein n=1 Tax=Streptomyces acidiscabies TaxID=42234 RepID=A0ABU4MF00_9ACTN|nr:amino acid adenylation domain-containing protein [Streptomyces acidiscabies]MDX3025807.1 amino acid adenylation domain-containing protein [Streptomyces acidiscabies]